MNKNPYQALFDLISKNAKQSKSLYQINKIQLKNKNEFIHTFFENILKEGELSNLADFAKHEKLIFLIKTMFKNSFEPAGGKQYRFYHSQNVAYLANIIAHNLNLSESDRDIIITTALLHDIGKTDIRFQQVGLGGFKEIEKELNINHDEIGAKFAEMLLTPLAFDKKVINIITNTIKNKEISDDIYSKIIFDADNMAELGEIQIFRTFYYHSFANQTMQEAIEYWFNFNRKAKLTKINKTKTEEKTKSLMMEKFNYIDNFIQKAKDYKD